jgi:hypothetical protein
MDATASKILKFMKENENEGIALGDLMARLPELSAKIDAIRADLVELQKNKEGEGTPPL